MWALKTGFPRLFEDFSASSKEGGEYLSCSLWQQRISVLLALPTILVFHSLFLKCGFVGARQGAQKSGTTWQTAGEISKSIWRTIGKKNPLSSQLQGDSKRFTWRACYADLSPAETYTTGAPLSWRPFSACSWLSFLNIVIWVESKMECRICLWYSHYKG